MNSQKKSLILSEKKKVFLAIFILLIAAFIAIYCFVYFIVIPKSAVLLIPEKWQQISAGQVRNNYLRYLGDATSNINSNHLNDTWIVHNGNYEYNLQIEYNADSVSTGYSISYSFTNAFFKKKGVIISNTASDKKSL